MHEPSDVPVLPAQVISERTHLLIPSLPNWIEPTVDYLRQRAVVGGACQETRSGKLMVALHEAITNAIVHGNLEVSSELKEQGSDAFAEALAHRAADRTLSSRKVDIVVDFDGEICRWIITDEGRGFDVERVLARCLSDDPEILLASGRGILMMKSFLDDVRFTLGGRQVILSLARTSGVEKRKDTRVSLISPFRVTPVDADGSPDWSATYEAVSRNFSGNGVSLLQQQLQSSRQVLIGIPTESGIVQIPAEVKHTRPLGAHGMELGCQFVTAEPQDKPPTPPPVPPPPSPQIEQVHRAVTEILEACKAKEVPSHERRIHPRVVFTERVSIRVDATSKPIVGYARDLSKGGIALITEEPLPGDVTITFAETTTREALKVRCRVVRCSLIQEGYYDIGATFLRVVTKT